MIDRKKWFLDRIGKRVYPDKVDCDCKMCENLIKKGMIITNEQDAIYLYHIEIDSAQEGTSINFRDVK